MDDLERQFAEFTGMLTILEIAGLIFLLALVSETVWDFASGTRKKGWETLANFVIGVVNVLLERTIYGLVFVVGLYLMQPFALFSIPSTWWTWILAVLAADFTYYWMHRWEHEVRILWSFHSVHHSSPEFNFTTALRLAWLEGLIEWIFFLPMLLIGFSVVQTIIALSIVVAYQSWIHTEKVGKLGWLDGIFNTPSVHRVHHGSNDAYLDKNYGGLLILWDRLFGTYQKEEQIVIYGIKSPLGTSNPFVINFREPFSIIADVWHAKSVREAFGYVFGKPGWKPERPPSKQLGSKQPGSKQIVE